MGKAVSGTAKPPGFGLMAPLLSSQVVKIMNGVTDDLTAKLQVFAHMNYLHLPPLPPQHKHSQTGYSLSIKVNLSGTIGKVNQELGGTRQIVYPLQPTQRHWLWSGKA